MCACVREGESVCVSVYERERENSNLKTLILKEKAIWTYLTAREIESVCVCVR